MRPTQLCHDFLARHVRPGDAVVDATAGNGHDTVFLARLAGETGKVYAFDIQPQAIAATRARLAAEGLENRVVLLQASHATLAAYVSSATAVVFNLGYLPSADHAVITTPAETLAALDAAAGVLDGGGLLLTVCYPGHEGGGDEAAAVEGWFSRKAQTGWRVARYGMIGTRRPAPFLLAGKREGPAGDGL